jgi:hypothetical protein
MKSDYRIYREWHRKTFGYPAEPKDSLDTKLLMDSLMFQSYLARYRLYELMEIVCESIICRVQKVIDFIKKYFNKIKHRKA